jgi:hypothetical protein
MTIQWHTLQEWLENSRAEHQTSRQLPAGEYAGRIAKQEIVRDSWGRLATRITLEVTEGSHRGAHLIAYVFGSSKALVESRAAHGATLLFSVYSHHRDDGRVFSRLNAETLRLASSTDAARTAVLSESTLPTAADIQQAAADLTVGFVCTDRIDTPRTLVAWHEHFEAMATYSASDLHGRCVFGSTYTFTNALRDHIETNDRSVVTTGADRPSGSIAGFTGIAYSPLLTFDIDGHDPHGGSAPAAAQQAAIRLVDRLVQLGVPADLLLVFFSGSKGFHVQFPSALAGAQPAVNFAAVAGHFCREVAGHCGVTIDSAMYRTLQPLRSPNSRNEKSMLFKVRVSAEELRSLPIEEIEALAQSPRPFAPPGLIHEPIPGIAALWRQAVARALADAKPRVTPGDADDDARIFRATWDFLLNGAEEGSRATELFKAAANLMDFASIEELVRALLTRPAVLSGLSPQEAASHIDGAVRRATGAQ